MQRFEELGKAHERSTQTLCCGIEAGRAWCTCPRTSCGVWILEIWVHDATLRTRTLHRSLRLVRNTAPFLYSFGESLYKVHAGMRFGDSGAHRPHWMLTHWLYSQTP